MGEDVVRGRHRRGAVVETAEHRHLDPCGLQRGPLRVVGERAADRPRPQHVPRLGGEQAGRHRRRRAEDDDAGVGRAVTGAGHEAGVTSRGPNAVTESGEPVPGTESASPPVTPGSRGRLADWARSVGRRADAEPAQVPGAEARVDAHAGAFRLVLQHRQHRGAPLVEHQELAEQRRELLVGLARVGRLQLVVGLPGRGVRREDGRRDLVRDLVLQRPRLEQRRQVLRRDADLGRRLPQGVGPAVERRVPVEEDGGVGGAEADTLLLGHPNNMLKPKKTTEHDE